MKNRIGILGDIHCQDKKLEIALKYLKGTVEKIYCVGDIVDGKGSCQACIDKLRKYEVKSVKGNHDRWFLNNEMRGITNYTKSSEISDESINLLKSLPQTLSLSLNGYRILICHGINKNDMAMLKPDDYGYGLECKDELWEVIKNNDFDLMLTGHTHQDMVRKIEKMWIVNAGSFDSEENANFIILDLENKVVQSFQVKENGVEVKGSISIRNNRVRRKYVNNNMTRKELLEIKDNIFKLKYENLIVQYLNTLEVVWSVGSVQLDGMSSGYPNIFLSFNKDREIEDVEVYK